MDYQNSKELNMHAMKAGWFFALINLSALILYFLGAPELAFVMLGVQALAITVWIFPVFMYHLVAKRVSAKISVLRAVASYKLIFEHVSW